jgi:hypothetical protein
MTLEQRVRRLETQNRWVKGAAAILFSCCAAGILMAQGSPKQEPLSSMMLQSRKGAKTAMAWLKCEPTGVVKLDLLHLGPRRNAQITIGIDQNGIPYFRIEDSRGNDLVKLTLEEDESPSLTFYDKKGKVIWKAPTK